MLYNTLLCWSGLGANYQELLTIFYQKVNKLIELTERWIGYDNIVVTVVNILETHTFICFWIVSTYTD